MSIALVFNICDDDMISRGGRALQILRKIEKNLVTFCSLFSFVISSFKIVLPPTFFGK